MNFAVWDESDVDFSIRTMTYFLRFRRFALLLLSLTLSAQAMAVASFGACHRVTAALSATHLGADTHTEHAVHANMVVATDQKHDSHSHHGDASHEPDSNDSSKNEKSRVKCAACAGCHLLGAVLPAEHAVAEILKSESTHFLEFTVPRVRNVASGLERPPRA